MQKCNYCCMSITEIQVNYVTKMAIKMPGDNCSSQFWGINKDIQTVFKKEISVQCLLKQMSIISNTYTIQHHWSLPKLIE